jgi:hypothetical protein
LNTREMSPEIKSNILWIVQETKGLFKAARFLIIKSGEINAHCDNITSPFDDDGTRSNPFEFTRDFEKW